MPKIDIGTTRFTEVYCDDTPGVGGACHVYHVRMVNTVPPPDNVLTEIPATVFASASFQEGPVGEAGVNGCHNEDLLAIVMHRLQGFQSGKYACYENGEALACIQAAMNFLANRTMERQARGVDGTHVV